MSNQDFTEQDLQAAWKELADKKFSNNTIEKTNIMNAINQESNSTIAKLKRGLKHKLWYAIGFAILFTIMPIIDSGQEFYNTFFYIAMAIAYYIGSYFMYVNYKNIASGQYDNRNLLESMKTNLNWVKSTLRVEKIWGIFTFIGIGAYFIIKNLLENGKSEEALALLIVLVLLIIIIIGFIANKMNQSHFGSDIKKLEENIIRLETLQ